MTKDEAEGLLAPYPCLGRTNLSNAIGLLVKIEKGDEAAIEDVMVDVKIISAAGLRVQGKLVALQKGPPRPPSKPE